MYVLDREVVAEKEGFVVCRANGRILVPSPPSSMNSWTQHMNYYYHIFLTDYLLINRNCFLFCLYVCLSCLSASVLCTWRP